MARSEGLEPSLKVLETLVLPDKLRTHSDSITHLISIIDSIFSYFP